MDETSRAASIRSKKNFAKFKNLSISLNTLLILVLVLLTAFFAWKYSVARKQVKDLKNPQVAVKQEADQLKTQVSQLVELPNEQPTVATVSDASKLKGQQFFSKAQNGDKVLIFPTARRAVLYRPSTNKV